MDGADLDSTLSTRSSSNELNSWSRFLSILEKRSLSQSSIKHAMGEEKSQYELLASFDKAL